MFDKAKIERVIAEFDYDNYGMDDVSHAISEDPEAQEWIPALAAQILESEQNHKSLDKAKWCELPDRTLVRDSLGELRLVHHGRDGDIWLWRWSDEYGAYHAKDRHDTEPRVHDLAHEEIDELVTVLKVVEA